MSLIDTEAPKRFRFDYRGMHRYLLRLPGFGSRKVFGEQETVVSVLNCLRDAAQEHRFDVYAYCFLPAELVMIVRGKDDEARLKEFLSAFRAASSSAIAAKPGHSLWKKKYLERVLRKTEDTGRAVAEVFELPVKAGLAKTAAEYPLQGSFVFAGEEKRRR